MATRKASCIKLKRQATEASFGGSNSSLMSHTSSTSFSAASDVARGHGGGGGNEHGTTEGRGQASRGNLPPISPGRGNITGLPSTPAAPPSAPAVTSVTSAPPSPPPSPPSSTRYLPASGDDSSSHRGGADVTDVTDDKVIAEADAADAHRLTNPSLRSGATLEDTTPRWRDPPGRPAPAHAEGRQAAAQATLASRVDESDADDEDHEAGVDAGAGFGERGDAEEDGLGLDARISAQVTPCNDM